MVPEDEFHMVLNSLLANLLHREEYRNNPFDLSSQHALWFIEEDIGQCYEALTFLSKLSRGE